MDFDVYRTAKLAKFMLTKEEALELGGQIKEMLESIEILPDEITDANESQCEVIQSKTLREDASTASLLVEQVLLNAPEARADCFVAPSVR